MNAESIYVVPALPGWEVLIEGDDGFVGDPVIAWVVTVDERDEHTGNRAWSAHPVTIDVGSTGGDTYIKRPDGKVDKQLNCTYESAEMAYRALREKRS